MNKSLKQRYLAVLERLEVADRLWKKGQVSEDVVASTVADLDNLWESMTPEEQDEVEIEVTFKTV